MARTADPVEPAAETPAHASIQGIAPALLAKARGRLEFLYAEVAQHWPGFIARPGQYQMMQAALLTFLSSLDLGGS